MKTCPVCSRIYSDETFSFCLEDGALLSVSYDPQATVQLPPPADTETPSVLTVPSNLPPTRQFQADAASQSNIFQKLLDHLKDNSQTFSKLGKFPYNNKYIWTNGHFFEIAESMPPILKDFFPLKEDSSPGALVGNLQTQLATSYVAVRSLVASNKERMIDLLSDKYTCRVNDIYYQYLHLRYPKASVMIGMNSYNPALFVSGNNIRAGIMGVKM